jgi:pimeloyl-ACP methyl ester carboxylesterase
VASRRRRAAWVGLGVAAGTTALVLTERALVRHLRARADPEAQEPFGTLPPDDLGPVRAPDGTDLCVRAAGPDDAPALVFVHGFSLDLTSWYYQWQAFSDRYRCVLFDHRAHGRSGLPPSGDYSIEALGRDLRAVLDGAVPAGPAVLVGHSLGGATIMSFAEQFPEEFGTRIAGAVFLDTWASDIVLTALGAVGDRIERIVGPPLRALLGAPDRAERIRRLVQGRAGDLPFLIAWLTNFGPDASPSVVDHVARVATETPAEVWIHSLDALVRVDLREALANITVPSLVIAGDRDRITPPASAQQILERLPDARGILLTRTGHVSQMERPGLVNGLLAEYFDQVFARETVTHP